MAEVDAKNPNGKVVVETSIRDSEEEVTLCTLFNRSVAVFSPGSDWNDPLFKRIKYVLDQNAPLLRLASQKTGRHVLDWTRRGSPLRALFVFSVGTIALLVLTGLLIFMLFFVVATFNAAVLSLLVSLAAAGGFLALFFAFVAAIYVGALLIGVFAVSTATICAAIVVFIATGWIGFFFIVWLAAKKSANLA